MCYRLKIRGFVLQKSFKNAFKSVFFSKNYELVPQSIIENENDIFQFVCAIIELTIVIVHKSKNRY